MIGKEKVIVDRQYSSQRTKKWKILGMTHTTGKTF